MSFERVNLREYIVTSVWFECNNDCNICMLSGMRQQLPPIGFDHYRDMLNHIVREGKYRKLILSGSEVTTFEELDRYVRFAVSLDWFEKIQIQTNGRRLCDRQYLSHLVACGVNEFFVSIHGTENVHDGIADREGAFRETMAGLENMESMDDVNVISNTVLTRLNAGCVAELMRLLVELPISEIHMWNYFPMASQDDRDRLVSLSELADVLEAVTSVTIPSGRTVVLKAFPECLSFDGAIVDSGYPETVLPTAFWEKFGECGFGACVHRPPCSSQECWGLCHAYIDKFGDEKELLKPIRS